MRIQYIDDQSIAKIARGIPVNRATAALPASTTGAIFTIAGGRVLLLQLLGEVTTVIQAQATTLKAQANPTAAGASVDLCATGDVNAAAVGTLLGITGAVATALQIGLAVIGMTTPQVIQAGTIDLVTVATSTGSVKWQMRYLPLDNGVTVVAA